jgi:hypothetical protein
MRTPSSRELSRRSAPRVEETGKTGFNSTIAGNQINPGPFTCIAAEIQFALLYSTGRRPGGPTTEKWPILCSIVSLEVAGAHSRSSVDGKKHFGPNA